MSNPVRCKECQNLFNDCLELYLHKRDYCPNSSFCQHCGINRNHHTLMLYMLNKMIGEEPVGGVREKIKTPEIPINEKDQSLEHFFNDNITVSNDNQLGLTIKDIWNVFRESHNEILRKDLKKFLLNKNIPMNDRKHLNSTKNLRGYFPSLRWKSKK